VSSSKAEGKRIREVSIELTFESGQLMVSRMRCLKCGSYNPTGKRFCGDCGAPLTNHCLKCGAENPPAKRFCGDCGSALFPGNATQSAPSSLITPNIAISAEQTPELTGGERKTVTALFADIKGSMDLIEDLDPEEARTVLDPALKLMIDAVHHYGGYIVQSTGDGIFALFGAPIAHEDHPQRGLYAALSMQEQLGRYSNQLRGQGRLPLQARVGLNTGEVVVRSLETSEGHTEYTPIGHSTSLAARMQVLAPVGSIAVTDATRKQCEGFFTFKPLGPTVVKGVKEPVEVFEVTGLGPLRTRLQRSASRGFTKFVGREHEMAALQRAAQLAQGGHGQVVAAMAEPGVGKSRLFHEFKLISQSGWITLEAFSVSYGKASAYLPVLELLRDYFRINASDDQRIRREKVTGRILALDRSLDDTVPYLFALLGLSESDDLLAQMDAQMRRRRTHESIKRILLRESINQGLMVIFEDLHWIDNQTQSLLNLLVDSVGTARILLLVNYRPEYSHEWGNRTYYTQLRLDPLGRDSAEEMLNSLLGGGAQLAPLKRLIIERTEGNPFFIEEIYQALLDEGALVRNGGIKLVQPLRDLRIPPTVQAILSSRIDRLPAAEKELLQTLAVIGKEQSLDMITAITRKGDEQLEPILSRLQLGEFIYEQPSLSGVEYTFKHALTLEVAYNSLLARRRRQLHDQTARALETLYPDRLEDHYSALARHYLLGDDARKAFEYARLAVEQAASRAAYAEALNLIEAALKLVDVLPEDAERLRTEFALRTIESMVAFVLFGASSHRRELTIRRMCELGERLGERAELVGGQIHLSNIYFTRGEALRGIEVASRALELLEGTKDADLPANAHLSYAYLAGTCGRLRDAVAHFDQALENCVRATTTTSFDGLSYRSVIRCMSARAVHLLGRVGEAAKLAADGLRHAREANHLFSLGHALAVAVGWLTDLRRDTGAALAHGAELITLAEDNHFAEWLPWGQIIHGRALFERGEAAEGLTEMEIGISGCQRLGGVPRLQYCIALYAEATAKIGRLEEALTTLSEALTHVEQTGEQMEYAEMLRLRGELLLMRDRSATAEAENSFRAALEVARAQEAKWWELRTSVSLARLLRDTHSRDEARTILSDIYNWFTEGFDLPDLRDAKSMLDELSR
jgi:class 3 adenylate cyclase/tetratricopeptide (TPR) repeat protein